MESEWVKVTTETQFFYHLKRSEIIAFRVENSEAFVDRLDDRTYRVIINRPFMPAVEYVAETEDQVKQFFNEMKQRNVCFWVYPGATLKEQEAPAWKKLIGWLASLLPFR